MMCYGSFCHFIYLHIALVLLKTAEYVRPLKKNISRSTKINVVLKNKLYEIAGVQRQI